jgi:hypothetical protein
MTGCLRLDRFIMVSHRLCVVGVFAGELLDADGTTIGWGSRRKTAPAEIVRDLRGLAAVIGPVDVDLMGMTVSVAAFTIHAAKDAPVVEIGSGGTAANRASTAHGQRCPVMFLTLAIQSRRIGWRALSVLRQAKVSMSHDRRREGS